MSIDHVLQLVFAVVFGFDSFGNLHFSASHMIEQACPFRAVVLEVQVIES
jgi:hypothetical protein